jgi:bifunctional UDP-N-acetylglucosamine pyrophosphorylase/glucosamine-1-phosphate N-acetyltransferase/UDP-N-acetylglucosamine pyrophosphorylase
LSDKRAIILAAGKGTRMKSDLPKVLVPVLDRPMIHYVMEAVRAAGIRRMLVVVGYRSDLVRAELAGQPGVEFVEQSEQLGTGHAVMMCRPALTDHDGGVFVLTGDSPLTQTASLMRLAVKFDESPPACLIGTAHKPNPTGLGRVVRDGAGQFLKIIEDKDASPEERAIQEVNMSTYLFTAADLLWALDRLTRSNVQKEYYITDCPGILKAAGKLVAAEPVLQPCEAMSINTVEELAAVEQAMRSLDA